MPQKKFKDNPFKSKKAKKGLRRALVGTSKQRKRIKENAPFKIGDTITCIDKLDSHGLLKTGRKYVVVDTDGIRVQLENVPLTWLNNRFK